MPEHDSIGAERRVRVAVVDDSEDIRALLRVIVRGDPRFELVGEGGDGYDAIELVSGGNVDVLVLDRNMPDLDGFSAIPEIRHRAPRTAIVLYTAAPDPAMAHAALAAGVAGVVPKGPEALDLMEHLTDLLVNHWAGPDADVDVRVGPVPSSAARLWVANTATIVAAIRAHPEVVEVPVDVLDTFEGFLMTWEDLAKRSEEFQWAARARAADVRRVVEHWALIDGMTDAQMEALGCHWSPPEARAFFPALTSGVLHALAAHSETQALARTLSQKWTV